MPIEDAVKKEGERFIVNWKVVHESDSANQLKDHLKELGILSYETEGNFGLVGSGMLLNPNHFAGPLNFTKREYAEQFRDEIYANATYSVKVVEFKE